jgi:hypothetical protein
MGHFLVCDLISHLGYHIPSDITHIHSPSYLKQLPKRDLPPPSPLTVPPPILPLLLATLSSQPRQPGHQIPAPCTPILGINLLAPIKQPLNPENRLIHAIDIWLQTVMDLALDQTHESTDREALDEQSELVPDDDVELRLCGSGISALLGHSSGGGEGHAFVAAIGFVRSAR